MGADTESEDHPRRDRNLTCFALKNCDDVIEDAGDAFEEDSDRLSDEERIQLVFYTVLLNLLLPSSAHVPALAVLS